jgi:group I intron endonuclease
MYGLIYLLTAPNGKSYVGQTTGTLSKRWMEHTNESANNASGCRHLNSALCKYGPDSFEKQIVAETESKESLDNLEKLWIILLQTDNPLYGYNLKSGGSHGKHSEETKVRLSLAKAGRKMTPEVVANHHPFLGKKHSAETRFKISEANKGENAPWFGKSFSPEHLEKLRQAAIGENNPFFGKHHTEEAKEKNRQAHLGKTASVETKNKISAALKGEKAPWFGKHRSDETRRKISESKRKSLPPDILAGTW